eukprot:scaffold294821_cov37-Prasinocladus_malaysianus.AAC.2
MFCWPYAACHYEVSSAAELAVAVHGGSKYVHAAIIGVLGRGGPARHRGRGGAAGGLLHAGRLFYEPARHPQGALALSPPSCFKSLLTFDDCLASLAWSKTSMCR